MRFKVVDLQTGKEPDIEELAHEEWAEGLIACDMEGFAITDNGRLMLVDECGGSRYCPLNRFSVIPLEDDEYSKSQQNIK